MATIAPGLNFRIGADVKGINKAIREAEKSLRGAVSSFSSIGNSLSLALSAPLAAFGAMSVKAAGDIESLRFALEGTMKDAGRSVNEARIELEELRKAALAPGLDFEQAVKGSVRLQSVGFEAEQARKIIVELANALALSGGTADQLDGVTKQFTQIIGKGRILQEDLTIILENMPVLAKVMKDEFGTATAEGLRDLGVSAEQFVLRLTNRMGDLERAQGGIANSIVNAQNAIRQALASVGEELNKTFNISGKLNAFADWVMGLAASFRNLDDGTKRLVVGIGVFALALGPAFKAMQYGVLVFGKTVIALKELQKWLALVSSAQGLQGVVKWFGALNVVTKASIIGGIAAVVLAAAAAFSVLGNDMRGAAKNAGEVKEAMREVNLEAAREAAALNSNIEILKKANSSQDERRRAIKALQDQYPEYLGNIDLEKASLGDLDIIQKRLNKSILQSVAARKQSIMVDEQFAKIADAKLRLQEIEKKGFEALTGEEVMRAGRSLFGSEFEKGFVMDSAQASTVSDVIKILTQDIKDAESAIDNINTSFKEAFAVGESVVATDAMDAYYGVVKKGSGVVDENTGKTKTAKTALDAYLETVKQNEEAQKKWNEARAAMGLAPLETLQLPALEAPVLSLGGMGKAMTGGMDGALKALKTIGAEIPAALTPAQAIMKALTTETLNFKEAFDLVAETMMQNGSVFQQIGFGVVSALEGLADAGKGLEEMAGGVVASLKKIVGGLIKTGVASVVTKALLSTALNPFAALALGAATGALAQGLFNSLINKVKIPALAEGGVLTSPTFVMAGEYAGARTNPEIVTPENKMRDVFREVMAAGGGGGFRDGQIVSVIRGDDVYLIWKKRQAKEARIR